ncbi:MAG: Rpp14/Pop5 family protein [Candidatus Bathyarchaeota archaeon]|nr:Rpp14/Pop5 family protein [Candidatus Bathyarchaeota archaeon]
MPVRSVRRRYLWAHLESETHHKEETVHKAIEAKIHFLYGVKGASEMNYRLIEFYPEEQNIILRCNHNRLNEMRAVLAHISEIDDVPVRIDVKLVSGTIKSLKKNAGI